MRRRFELPIILASTSPRRSDVMKQVGLKFSVEAPDVDEAILPREAPKALVARLAKAKALAVKDKAIRKYQDCVIIAADTMVVAPDGKSILGKPRNEMEARKMLKSLSGKKHTVFTGYCIVRIAKNTNRNSGIKSNSKVQVFTRVVQSKVTMRSLSSSSIEKYISTGEPMDKAGSYGAQGLGVALIEKIQGSHANVVGLPIAQVLMDFEKIFKINLFNWLS